MSAHPNSELPSYELELRAAEERKRLHASVKELKERVHEKLDLTTNARQYVIPLSAAVALISLAVGYAFGGILTRH
jgi:hypothetical protein